HHQWLNPRKNASSPLSPLCHPERYASPARTEGSRREICRYPSPDSSILPSRSQTPVGERVCSCNHVSPPCHDHSIPCTGQALHVGPARRSETYLVLVRHCGGELRET